MNSNFLRGSYLQIWIIYIISIFLIPKYFPVLIQNLFQKYFSNFMQNILIHSNSIFITACFYFIVKIDFKSTVDSGMYV